MISEPPGGCGRARGPLPQGEAVGKSRSGKLHLQRRFLRKRGAAVKFCDAVCLYSSSREKVNLENPQIFQICKY